MEEKLCPECGRPVFGRIDKKFCSDACRNAFNNKANAASTNYMRNVNNILSKNRRILAELNPDGKKKTHKDKLLKKGFDFGFPDTKNEDSFSPYFTLNENGELFK